MLNRKQESLRAKWKNLRSEYRIRSVYFKNMYRLLVLVFVPILCMVLLSIWFCQELVEREIGKHYDETATELLENVKSVLQDGRKEMVSLGLQTDVNLFLYDKDFTYEQYSITLMAERIMLEVISREYLLNMYIYNVQNDRVLSKKGVALLEEADDVQILKDCVDTDRAFWAAESHVNGYPRSVLCVQYRLKQANNLDGIFVMVLDHKKLLEYLGVKDLTEFYIIDKDEIIVASDGQYAIDAVEWLNSEKWENRICGEYYMVFKEDKSTGMQLAMRSRLADEAYRDSPVRLYVAIFLSIAICLSLVGVILISHLLFQPVRRILSLIKEYSNVLLMQETEFVGRDELNYIFRFLQQSLDDRIGMEEELERRIVLLRKAQAVALQSQINPHFIYNTLESVNWTALRLLGCDNEISEMVGALSKMLRLSLAKTEMLVSIRQEYEHCQCYLLISQKRFLGKFLIQWEIEEEVYSCKIIKIVLQPLVENAIYHGLKPLTGEGRIVIKGSLNKSVVQLSVSDNGVGMTEERLKKVLSDMEGSEIKEEQHIGLANVNKRLRMFFGEQYGLSIESRENEGTTVTITVPVTE